jgi:hypothetical protein
MCVCVFLSWLPVPDQKTGNSALCSKSGSNEEGEKKKYIYIYTHTVHDYRQYSAIAVLHTSHFTVAQTLLFSVFTSHILATDLSQSHCPSSLDYSSTLRPVFYCQEWLFTGALLGNGCTSIIACACVAVMCLPTCCLFFLFGGVGLNPHKVPLQVP